jgi:TRAP-type uncharacterized transport system fused permease subunit
MIRMKFLMASLIAVLGFMFTMIGVDIFVHDETFQEALKGYPSQFIQSVGDLFALAWQYKFVTLVAFAILMAVLFVRGVPEVRNQ